MKSVADILELPVIEAEDGKELGIIIDVGLKTEAKEMAGLIINKKQQEYLIGPKQLYSLGIDYIILKEQNNFVPLKDKELLRAKQIIGTTVVTMEGDNLGIVKDILLTDEGELSGYELSDGLVQDILTGRNIIPVEQKIKYTDEKIIIEDRKVPMEELD